MHILGRRMVPIPDSIDSFHVVSEIEASDMSALDAVLAVDEVRAKLEAEAEHLSKLSAEAEVCVLRLLRGRERCGDGLHAGTTRV